LQVRNMQMCALYIPSLGAAPCTRQAAVAPCMVRAPPPQAAIAPQSSCIRHRRRHGTDMHAPSTSRVACCSSAYDNPALYTSEDTFAEASYWDKRYQQEPQAFEWYRGYASLRPLLLKYLPPQLPILQVGMGTSQIQYDMVAQDGYAHIMSVDYSSVAVEQQQAAHAHIPQLKYAVADARRLGAAFPDASYAGVLDKGTLDALLCGESDVEDSARMVEEVWRVLEPGGVYLQITHSPPKSRLRYLACEAGWASVDVWEVGQQGRCHGPYPVTLPAGAAARGLGPHSGLGADIEARETFSHWVFACRKRLEVCGLKAVEM